MEPNFILTNSKSFPEKQQHKQNYIIFQDTTFVEAWFYQFFFARTQASSLKPQSSSWEKSKPHFPHGCTRVRWTKLSESTDETKQSWTRNPSASWDLLLRDGQGRGLPHLNIFKALTQTNSCTQISHSEILIFLNPHSPHFAKNTYSTTAKILIHC